MAGVAAIATVVSTVAGVGGAVAQNRAIKQQNRAEENARNIDRRQAALENARQRRLAIAQRRIAEAETIQGGENQGAGQSSSVAGAVGALRTQTASNIGFQNTQIASNSLRANTLGAGYAAAARSQSFGNSLQGIATASQNVGTFAAQNPKFSFSQIPNPFRR